MIQTIQLKGLPIHKACEGVMCEKIYLLLDLDPSQAKLVVNEDSKRLPLHIACHPFQGIQFLILKLSSTYIMHTQKL